MNGGAKFTAGMAALGAAGVINTYKQYSSPGAKLLASKDKLYQAYKDTFSEGVDAAYKMMGRMGWYEDRNTLKERIWHERGTVFLAQNELSYIQFTHYLKAMGIPYTKYQAAYLTGWANDLFNMGRQSEMFLPDPPSMTPDWWADYLVDKTNRVVEKQLKQLTIEQRKVFDLMTEANKNGYSRVVLDKWSEKNRWGGKISMDGIYECERNYKRYKKQLENFCIPHIDWQVAVLSGWAFKIIEYDNKVQLDKFYDGRFSEKVEDTCVEMNAVANDTVAVVEPTSDTATETATHSSFVGFIKRMMDRMK
jgi:hypothetical protein